MSVGALDVIGRSTFGPLAGGGFSRNRREISASEASWRGAEKRPDVGLLRPHWRPFILAVHQIRPAYAVARPPSIISLGHQNKHAQEVPAGASKVSARARPPAALNIGGRPRCRQPTDQRHWAFYSSQKSTGRARRPGHEPSWQGPNGGGGLSFEQTLASKQGA